MDVNPHSIGKSLAASLVLVAVLVAPFSLNAQTTKKRATAFQDLIPMHRLSEPQISPDGKWVAYTVATPNLETNNTSRDIWIVSVASGEPRQLTHSGSGTRPRWAPDGQNLAFISARAEGNQQVFWMDL